MALLPAMTSRILILGAGLIGAGLAYELSCRGAGVTVIEAGLPASAASGRAFGWINASFSLSAAHFRARVAAMAGHRRWEADLGYAGYLWQGCLWWEQTGAAFDQMAKDLAQQAYPLVEIGRAEFAKLEPSLVRPPNRALLFSGEGAVDAAQLARHLLQAASARGAKVLQGCPVAQILMSDGQVSGVRTAQGIVLADQVILATGTGTPAMLADLGLRFPMQTRPGAILRTHPISARIHHILAGPEQELRQDKTGAILAPAPASHQGHEGDTLANPEVLARETLARLSDLLGTDLALQGLTLADRPVPGDGLPAVGAVPGHDGLFMAVLHSGVTLAPIVAASLADQVTGKGPSPEMAPFGPARLLMRPGP